jgi:hypothetical protein
MLKRHVKYSLTGYVVKIGDILLDWVELIASLAMVP